jgi:hypothetical protein
MTRWSRAFEFMQAKSIEKGYSSVVKNGQNGPGKGLKIT